MYELPLFPLNTVLFPGGPLKLQIFEPRYLLMIERCLEDPEPKFGVVLIRKGVEALGPLAEPHPVGCTARILRVEPLPDGRSLLHTIGGERFRIHSRREVDAYLVAQVEPLPLTVGEAAVVNRAAARLKPYLARYVELVAEARGQSPRQPELPEDSVELGYIAAGLLELPPKQKQALLTTDDAQGLISSLGDLYRREIALLTALRSRSLPQDMGPYPLN